LWRLLVTTSKYDFVRPESLKVGIFTAKEIKVSVAQMNFMQEKPLYRLTRNWSINARNLTFDTFRSAPPLFTKKKSLCDVFSHFVKLVPNC
jgi:hypothetical protein